MKFNTLAWGTVYLVGAIAAVIAGSNVVEKANWPQWPEPKAGLEPGPLRILEMAPGALRTIAVCPKYEAQIIRTCIGSMLNDNERLALHIVNPVTGEHQAGEFTPSCAVQPGGCPKGE